MAAALRRNLKPFFPRAAHFSATTESQPSSLSSIASVAAAIRSEPDPDRILDLFSAAAARIPRFHAHRPIYRLSVMRLARARRPDLVERLLEPQLSAPKSEGFLLRLVSLYSSARMPDHAARTLRRITTLGCAPTEKSLCALLTAFLDNKQHARAIESFESLPGELSISPGVTSYGIFLKALCEDGRVDDACSVLDEMPSRGVKPDIVSYNAVLNGYLMSGDDDKFEEVLKEIAKQGLDFNVFTYNCRISALCRKGKSFEAEELLDVMVSKGLQPNLASFNVVIDGFCSEGDVGSALGVFKRMRVMKRVNGKDGVSPTADTYNVLLRSLVEKGEFGSALVVCQECLMRKLAPSFEVVKSLIEGLTKDLKVDEAKSIVKKMKTVLKGDAVDAWNKLEGALSL